MKCGEFTAGNRAVDLVDFCTSAALRPPEWKQLLRRTRERLRSPTCGTSWTHEVHIYDRDPKLSPSWGVRSAGKRIPGPLCQQSPHDLRPVWLFSERIAVRARRQQPQSLPMWLVLGALSRNGGRATGVTCASRFPHWLARPIFCRFKRLQVEDLQGVQLPLGAFLLSGLRQMQAWESDAHLK